MESGFRAFDAVATIAALAFFTATSLWIVARRRLWPCGCRARGWRSTRRRPSPPTPARTSSGPLSGLHGHRTAACGACAGARLFPLCHRSHRRRRSRRRPSRDRLRAVTRRLTTATRPTTQVTVPITRGRTRSTRGTTTPMATGSFATPSKHSQRMRHPLVRFQRPTTAVPRRK